MHKMPTFSTGISVHVTGKESRAIRQAFPLWEFDVTHEVLREQTQNQVKWANTTPFTELEQISQLQLSCLGKYGEFYFEDVDDNSRLAAPQIYPSDGAAVAWRIFRQWGYSPLTSYEPVGGINLGQTINVYLDAGGGPVLQAPSSYTVTNLLSGSWLTFNSPPAANQTVTMDFFYYYRCHFIEDMQEYEEFYKNLWNAKSIKFRSVKP